MSPSPPGDRALVLADVSVRLGEGRALLGASLRLAPGDLVVLLGPNGAGKTTLLRAALGIVPAERGEVLLGGRPVQALRPRERAARVAWLPQSLPRIEPQRAVDFVAGARYRFGEGRAQAEAGAMVALEKAGAAALAPRRLPELSGGERQRVRLAALLAQEAPLALLDEPGASLDPRARLETAALTLSLWQGGLGVLWVTHDLSEITAVLPLDEHPRVRVMGLAAGRLRPLAALGSEALGADLGALFELPVRALALPCGRRAYVHEAPP